MISEAWVVPVLAALVAGIISIVLQIVIWVLNRRQNHATADKTDAEGVGFISEAATKTVKFMQSQVDCQTAMLLKQGQRITDLEVELGIAKSELGRMRAQLVVFRLDLTELVRGVGVLDFQITSGGQVPNWKPEDRLRSRYQEILNEARQDMATEMGLGA